MFMKTGSRMGITKYCFTAKFMSNNHPACVLKYKLLPVTLAFETK